LLVIVRAGAHVVGRAGRWVGASLGGWVPCADVHAGEKCTSMHDYHETSTLGAHFMVSVHAGARAGGGVHVLGVFWRCVELIMLY
jgi:hypothetical protein